MCEYCKKKGCTLSKDQAIEHGPILEINASCVMRELDNGIFTYAFDDIPCYYSLSALIPDGSEENPHAYYRYLFDEDEGYYHEDDTEHTEVKNPLVWQTEKEFLEKIGC